MSEDNVYGISDLNGFCEHVRSGVAEELRGNLSSSEMSNENLDDFITLKQVENLVREKQLGHDNEDEVIYIDTKAFGEIWDEVENQIYGAALSKLAAEGLIESAWDDKLNDMVFWLSDKTKKDMDKN